MKIYIMTDMEGVCGVLDRAGWVERNSPHLGEGRKLLTREVNAAVEGFIRGGADEIHVTDGHGVGGLDPSLLDPRAKLITDFSGPYPFGLDESFDGIAWVGQHAKSGTEYAHIPHTGSHLVKDFKLNGTSVGEFGIMAMCASVFGVRPIFCSGDEAMALEARTLAPGIETAAVKRGLCAGSGDECDFEQYRDRGMDAEMCDPEEARALIAQGAENAVRRLASDKSGFGLIKLASPYFKEIEYRPRAGHSGYTVRATDDADLIRLLNTPPIG